VPDRNFEEWTRDSIRELEGYKNSSEAKHQERWKGQFLFNERVEDKVEKLNECVQKISTNQKVNNAKLTTIFVVVQIVIYALATAIGAYW